MLELDLLRNSLSDIFEFKKKELARFSSSVSSKLEMKKEEIIRIYQDVSKPNENESYTAALKFLKNEIATDIHLYDLVAFALNRPIDELDGRTVISNIDKLTELLNRYRVEIDRNEFWELTWFGVLQTYFQAPSSEDSTKIIRLFLEDTFNKIYAYSEHKPFWMLALKENQHLLSKDPCRIYAQEWLEGKDDRVNKIKNDINISGNSWFWSELISSCIRETTKLIDVDFKEKIPQLLKLIKQHPAYLDYGLHAALSRYRKCSDTTLNKDLKNLSVEIWKSPRLRSVGGSKWYNVDEPVWQMVLGWVNEANLRLFFNLLKRRGVADKNRLDFWLKYINQVRWTKLVLGEDTREYFKSNNEMAKIFNNEKDSFSSLDAERNLDAFIMQIGNYLIVEFSTEGGCYIYKDGENTFDPNSDRLNASTSIGGLKEKRRIKGSPDIIHSPGWQARAETKLMLLSIFPDPDILSNIQSKSRVRSYPLSNNADEDPISLVYESSSENKIEQTIKLADALALKYGIKTENNIYQGGKYWVLIDKKNGPVAEKLRELDFTYEFGKGWYFK